MSEVQIFNGLKVKEVNGKIYFDAESAAMQIGLTETKHNGSIYVIWKRVNSYLKLSTEVSKGDYITEQQVYKLAIKANSQQAEKFQDWITSEVLPSIRKTGGFQSQPTLRLPVNNVEMLQVVQSVSAETNKRVDELSNEFSDLKESFGLPNDMRKRFTKARNKRVVEVMGGYHGTAYANKKVRSAVYRQLSNFLKERYVIDEYASLPMSKFEEAMRLTANWEPDEILSLAINGANEQTLLNA